LWPNGWMAQDMLLGREGGIGPDDIVLDGDPAPPTKRSTAAPTFRPMSVVAKRQHGSRCHLQYVGKALAPVTLCYMGTQLLKGAQPPNFGPMSICFGQTAGWIKITVSTEPNGGRPRCVRWNRAPLTFRPLSIAWPNCWVDQDTTCYGGRIGQGALC